MNKRVVQAQSETSGAEQGHTDLRHTEGLRTKKQRVDEEGGLYAVQHP